MQIDHTGIAVRDLDEAISFYTNVLQGKLVDRYTNTAAGVETELAVIHVGEDVIELLLPTSSTSPIARFMKARGKGVHHIAYRVDDLEASIAALKRDGITFLEDTLRTTAKGRRLIYMDPRHSGGVIVELCDYPTMKQ
ncbi:VOC family protein [Exiguobacterium sp. SH3S2]|uniref:VOC family protein n=1 Tax=unclassified Exiguobacterium TaxID=2644629 RepID=UPI0010400F4B|nr:MULTISPECIES: VOC family protein [unclassified Exiguobacterium]TCI26908.1 VOC family protein [Exiguobacterium sp. SH5S4]TCI44456.1 VOC family protein [Exiguobacterium sp. SH3S3]TCI60014.1 VOC family protein [Exiguobacterium sp. SH3S2]TCI61096.1 VOC family protein [Exiguobacterium sp. SH3S1]